ncbi:MAG: crotonase/enoyl-CoA hydratase family protein [Desulfomonilia bacterium]
MSVVMEKTDGVTTIILNRPEVRNAVDGPTAHALAEAFRTFEQDKDSRVGVLFGAGGNFCAGADLKAISSGSGMNRLDPSGDAPMGPSRMFLSKPIIAAVAGFAVAGGLELALLCDLRVVEKSAVFGVFCRRWGVPLIDGGTVRLPRLIGLSRSLDMILTGRPVYSEEALAFGLANRIVEDGQSREKAEELARELIRFPQTCLRSDRRSTYEQCSMELSQALMNEFQHGMDAIGSGESLSGATDFSGGKGRHGSFSD